MVKSVSSFADHSFVNSQSLLHQFKVKIFCGLHSPVGFYVIYHLALLLLIFVNCFCINLSLDFNIDDHKRQQLTNAMIFLDIILLTILFIELCLRLYVSNCNIDYAVYQVIVRYLSQFKMQRLYDSFCIALLLFFVIVSRQIYGTTPPTIRILHFLLLFQFYRLFLHTFRHFVSVVQENFTLLVMSISMYTIVFTVATYGVYIFELYNNVNITSLFDTAWFSFISLATIGYGDLMIIMPITKVFIAICVMCGFTVFTLPGSIIGSAVALRLQDSRQKILCFHPAANLIQKTWRFYAIYHIDNYWTSMVINRAHQDSPNSIKQLTRKDEYVVLFISKLSFLLARSRFKYASLVHNTGSVPLQYAQLQRKIELINKAVCKHNYDINMIKYQLKKMIEELKRSREEIKHIKSIVRQRVIPSKELNTGKFVVQL